MTDTKKALILLVDDNPQNLKVLGSLLKEKGHRLAVAKSGSQAIEFVYEKKPDLILLDIMMPQMNGIQVCQKLKNNEKSKNIPILFISGVTDLDNKLDAFSAGGEDYITKPFQQEEVLARINIHLENRRLNRELRQANANLKDLNEIKNKFLGIASHDLRIPLACIKGNISLLTNMEIPKETQLELFEVIQKNSDHMLALVNDLLDISIIESGQLTLEKKPTLLKSLVEEKLSLGNIIAKNKEIKVYSDLAEVPSVMIDPIRVNQIIDNLISNAIKFSDVNTTIHISLKDNENSIALYVRDEGPGISEEEQSKLFGEFQRLSAQPTGGEKSIGLGLSISQKFAHAHGGKIEVKSELGIGTTFILLLPKE